MNGTMSIGELAREADVGVETIRYYERERLLPRPARTRSNYRRYDSGALGRLRFIRNAKDLGFTLEEIRKLLRASESDISDAGDFHDIAREKIEWIESRIGQLRRMRDVLAGAMAACPGHGADKADCPVLALLTGEPCGASSCTCVGKHHCSKHSSER